MIQARLVIRIKKMGAVAGVLACEPDDVRSSRALLFPARGAAAVRSFVMFGDAARFGNGLRPVPVSSDGTLFAFAKNATESAAHVGPGAYFSTAKENSR